MGYSSFKRAILFLCYILCKETYMIKEHKFEFVLTLLIIIIAVIGIIIAIKNNNLSNQALDNFKIIL